MANKNINDLPVATVASGKLEILQGGTNKQIDASLLGGSSTTPNLAQVLTEGYTANSSVLLTDGTTTELLLDPSYIQLKSTGLGSVLFDADAILDVVNYKGNELATLNDIPSLTGYEQTVNKDATGGYVGLTALKINFKNVLNTFTSFFTNSNTAARTYTFQDRNGTIADDTDLGLKSPIASPTFTGTVTTPAIIVSSETASRVAIIDASKNVKSADTTTYPSLTELSYGKGVTSAIQTQLDNKGSIQNYYSGKRVTIPFAGTSSAINGWNGAIIYIPIPITSSVAFTDISQEVTALTVGSNIRLALYTSVNGLPASLLEDSGNISTSTTGIKNYVLSAPHSFTAVDKQVFVAIQSSSAAVGLRYALNTVCFNYFDGSGQSGTLFYQVQVFRAFPATATPSVYPNANSPLVSLLVQ